MKKSTLLLFTFLCSLQVNANQTLDVPVFLLGNWSEASRADERDSFKIENISNPRTTKYTQDGTRQVGGEDTPTYPYPTVCRYRKTGTMTNFSKASNDTIEYFRKNGKEDPNFEFSYKVTKVTLLPALYNSPNCKFFIEAMNTLAANEDLSYTEYIRDLTDKVTADPWHNIIFEKQ
jgi:hypothetical protein